jgi:hypothetical protein
MKFERRAELSVAAQRRVVALAFMIRWCYIHTYAPV